MRPERIGLALVLLVYVGLAGAYAWLTPPWNNPDEPAHYNYVAFVAERGALPELVAGDWDQDLLSAAIPERFHPRFDISSIRYESHQPPLYYLISAPVYSATSSMSLRARVLALRVVSIVLGIALGVVAFKLARELAPAFPDAGPLAAATALLIPMSTATAASINNDMLAMMLAAIATLAVVRYVRRLWLWKWNSLVAPSTLSAAALGLVVGLLLLTKLTVYVFAGIAIGTVVVAALVQRETARRAAFARRAGITIAVALAVSGWWFLRSAGVYGLDDLLAQRRHDVVVVGQPRYADYGPANWLYLAVTAFHSFFAQFGWMTIVVDNLTYAIYAALAILAVIGVWVCRSQMSGPALLTLSAITGVVLVQLLYYNLSFIQAQGRYLFPALGAIAAVLSVGWSGLERHRIGAPIALVWASLATATAVGGIGNWDIGLAGGAAFVLVLAASFFAYQRVHSHRLAQWYVTAATVLGLSALNLMCLTRYVVPFYRG